MNSDQREISYSCPWCSYSTDLAKALVQHLAMAPASHAVLASGEFEQIKRELAQRWEEN